MSGVRADWCWASRRRVRALTLGAALCVAAALLGTPPANGLSQRGHEFGQSFGSGDLSHPSGLAVNEESGDVYVLDSANNRVVVFGPKHEFLQAWGAGVGKSGGKHYETCTSECKAGTAGFGKGQLDAPAAIAVDNSKTSPSHGDVYVVANHTAKKAVLDKFSASGEYMERVLGGHEEKEEFEENPIVGVAVGPTGTVWVEREAEEGEFLIQRLGNAIKNAPLGVPSEISSERLEGVVRPGLAVDGKGGLYVRYEPAGHTLVEQEEEEEEIEGEEKERKEEEKELKEKLPPVEKAQLPCERHPCIVAKFAVKEAGEGIEATPVVNPLDGLDSTGVAVDESSEAQSSGGSYVAHKTILTAFTAGGRPIQSFGAGALGETGGVAVDAETNEVLVSDVEHGVVDTFVPAHAAPPVVAHGSPVAAHVTSSSADLRATIDPTGSKSRYRFEYGTASCSEPGSECLTAPAKGAAAGELGQGFGDQTAAQVVVGLSPGVTYHLRVVVEYSFEEGGSTKSGTVDSEEKTFTTPASSLEAVLPDGRHWEKVSPTQKNGASIEASALEGGVVEASSSGKALTYTVTGPFGENEPEGYRGPEPSQILATRTSTGWTARDIATPNTEAEGARPGLPREYDFFSSELQGALLRQLAGKPILSAETSESSIYLRHNLTCAEDPTGCFEPIVSPKDDLANSKYGGGALDVLGASPDLQHVVLRSGVPLLEKAPQEGLYEWSSQSGQLTLLSVLPKKEGPAPGGGFLGAEGSNPESQEGLMTAAAISHDGSRIEWYPRGSKHLYTRDVQTGETLQVDELEAGLGKSEAELPAIFQNASADGSKIFFTDATRLTKSSRAPGQAAALDLYVFEPEQPEGDRLTDLSVPIHEGEAAAVQGAVTGVSEDGATVYFVANGELHEGAERGSCGEPGGTGCNLYVEHDGEGGWEQPRLVARLSSKDNPDWGEPNGPETYHLEFKTSEVSPNGQYLAFMSQESLTGYNNADASSGEPDEEVFLYHEEGASGQLICASCNPSGEQPTGVFDQLNSGEGQGLLVDRPRVWGGTLTENVARWLAGSVPGWTAFALYDTAYQPRYLTDQGRLFFNSSDSLVRRDVNNGKNDVYEFEPEGIGSCQTANTSGGCIVLISSGESERESAFLDASESGNDVFFLTSAKLSSTDTDNAYDVYDARVCEPPGSEPCIEPPAQAPEECHGEACRASYAPPAGFGTPASVTATGSGNLIEHVGVLGEKQKKATKQLTNAQKLAAALKACHRDKQKKKRLACERQARKHYPVKKASGAKASRAAHKPGPEAAPMIAIGGGR